MMPNMDGLELSKQLKIFDENIPIIILSAYSQKEKLLKAIDLGITKYFIKPFDPDEVIQYLESLAKKLNRKKIIKLDNEFTFNNGFKTLYKNEELIKLTKREKEFLLLLLKTPKTVVNNEAIKNKLWKDEIDNEKVSNERLRTFIKRFRNKTSKTLIENVSKQGYLISPIDS